MNANLPQDTSRTTTRDRIQYGLTVIFSKIHNATRCYEHICTHLTFLNVSLQNMKYRYNFKIQYPNTDKQIHYARHLMYGYEKYTTITLRVLTLQPGIDGHQLRSTLRTVYHYRNPNKLLNTTLPV